MIKKKCCLVSSTPHPQRNRHHFDFFEDVKFSPITEPPTSEVISTDHRPITKSKPRQSGAVKKRQIASKLKDAPESVTAGVLRELGAVAADDGNNALSHSRHLYNMYPEPIILDSDEEENSFFAKKLLKKTKQDSKISKSRTVMNKEEKKVKGLIPGSRTLQSTQHTAAARKTKSRVPVESSANAPSSSGDVQSRSKRIRTSHSTQRTAARKTKTQVLTESLDNVPSSSRDVQTKSKSRGEIENKRLTNKKIDISVVCLEDDPEDSVFPVYQPGSSVLQTSRRNRKEKVHLSVELDEKFPIEWDLRGQTVGGKAKDKKDIEKIEVHEDSEVENNKNRIAQNNKILKRKLDVLKDVVPKSSNEKCEDCHVAYEECESRVLISRFEDVEFKVNSISGGFVGKCLKTNQNDFGYLEVTEGEIFHGQSVNITYMIIEGKARLDHCGTQQTLLPGDMFHIITDGGYQLESAGPGHVRFLYIKEH